MKTFVTFLATISLMTLFSVTAQADSFSSTNSKRGFTQTRSTEVSDAAFAKFEWLTSDEDQTPTPVNHIIVSLADQRLYAYHDQQLIAWSNVSSGRTGHETPTGSFTVSQKDVDHHSSLYDDASMPFFMRLTDGGVGLHAGFLPGYPASHGCVRLPYGMARELYQHVEAGTPVEIISDSFTAPATKTATVTTNTSVAQG